MTTANVSEPTLWMRARFAMLEWKCRKFNLSRVSYDTGYLIRCKGRLCKAEWVIGHTLRPYHVKGKHPAVALGDRVQARVVRRRARERNTTAAS